MFFNWCFIQFKGNIIKTFLNSNRILIILVKSFKPSKLRRISQLIPKNQAIDGTATSKKNQLKTLIYKINSIAK